MSPPMSWIKWHNLISFVESYEIFIWLFIFIQLKKHFYKSIGRSWTAVFICKYIVD